MSLAGALAVDPTVIYSGVDVFNAAGASILDSAAKAKSKATYGTTLAGPEDYSKGV